MATWYCSWLDLPLQLFQPSIAAAAGLTGWLDRLAAVCRHSQRLACSAACTGVVVYDFDGPDMQPQLLVVREKTGAWNLPAGVPLRWVEQLLGSPFSTGTQLCQLDHQMWTPDQATAAQTLDAESASVPCVHVFLELHCACVP
jgi:hypothetical protein